MKSSFNYVVLLWIKTQCVTKYLGGLIIAISRAQSLAVVVCNPQLATTPANSVEQLALVNLSSSLKDYGEISGV